MRTLASIQVIHTIKPAENADSLELAYVLGWQVVVKKGVFNVGDLALFLEIDSVTPEEQRYAFLWKDKNPRPSNFRVKTIKLRGELSQGVLFPISEFPEIINLYEGQDVTEILNITKYEPIIRISGPRNNFKQGSTEAPFPAKIPKTDEQRIQSAPKLIYELTDLAYYITLKYDGTSATYTEEDGVFKACSRNHAKKDDGNVYWNIAHKYDLQSVISRNPGYSLQGEIIGPGIQGNKLNLEEIEVRFFNLLYEGYRMTLDETRDFMAKENLPMVEILEEGNSFNYDIPTLLAKAEGFYPNTQNEREGIVVRPIIPIYSEKLKDLLSFKAISNKFLLKGGE